MFCETEREILLFELLSEKFPKQHPHLLQLIAWCGINRPERLTEIMEQHAKDGDALIDLEGIDIKSLGAPTPSVRFSITDDVAEIKLDE